MSCFTAGLDLGQVNDPSAICVLNTRQEWDAATERRVRHHDVPYLHRWKLGTPFPRIVDDVRELLERPPLSEGVTTLAVDQTGVGRPIVEMLYHRGILADISPIQITAGNSESFVGGVYHVSKVILVATMQKLLQERRLHVSPELEEAKTLAAELTNFRVKVSLSTGNESYEAWRAGDHDDLVLSIACAAYLAEKRPLVTGKPMWGLAPKGERPTRDWRKP